eukprot:TRINITY_DN1001_c2_g1_i1.p1 TRINITY_DN1001_c2_g1~~TRINITY_DN1001_c2_g1_i1.p1  ORF type:complete len:629 (-),score=227.31 TRINITY_DN1001_c2_g1_i1:255-2141(-)
MYFHCDYKKLIEKIILLTPIWFGWIMFVVGFNCYVFCLMLLGWLSYVGIRLYLDWVHPFPQGNYKTDRPEFKFDKDYNKVEFTGDEIKCYNPGTGEFIGTETAATDEEVELCLDNAVIAQKQWKDSTFKERKAVLYDILQYVVNNQEEICEMSIKDTGKTMMEAFYGEILTTCEKLRYIIKTGEESLATEYRTPPTLLIVKEARVEYHPLGVIGIIIPWNYPFHNAISAIAAAIFSGNAAVVKVSEWATKSRQHFQDIFQNILIKRGFNPDLIQLLPGLGQTGGALCKSKKVNKILFIGSPGTGKKVMEAACTNLTPVILELGGKDPFIVLDDAEFDHAVEVALRGVFINQGQNCLAAERIYVQENIYDKFSDAIMKTATKLRQGAPPSCFPCEGKEISTVDCGAITMPKQVEIIDELVQDAIDNGATALIGGSIQESNNNNENENVDSSYCTFYPPTILTNLTHDMRIVNEEVFGPVMLLISFKSDEEVIELANSTDYGLCCSIFSTNYNRAENLAKNIISGMCTINDFGLSYLIQDLPFGGIKISGFGKFNGPEGLRGFSNQKSVVTDRFPVRTKAPRFTQYPVPDQAPLVIHNAVTFIYSGNVSQKVKSLINMVKALISISKADK